MKRTMLQKEEARARSAEYPYVLVRELSRLYLGKTENAALNWSEATEVRFFCETSELRFFEQGNDLAAVLLEDEEEDETTCLDRFCPLGHSGHFGKQITLREYFGYDSDGQLYVKAVRLKDWKG